MIDDQQLDFLGLMIPLATLMIMNIILKVKEPSLSDATHEWGPNMQETITVACITDCPTITVHAGKL